MVEEYLVMTDITLGDILANSPQYAILAIVIWAINKLGPILLKHAIQLEKINDFSERQEKKNADTQCNSKTRQGT